MLAERRKYTRFNIEAPVKCKILGRNKKNEISYEVPSLTRNLSEGGAYIVWPKEWACKVCINCLAWIFNQACILKEESELNESNKYLTPSTFIQVTLEPPITPEPIKVSAKVVWVKTNGQGDSYGVGLSFIKGDKGKLGKLRKRIETLKSKKKESS